MCQDHKYTRACLKLSKKRLIILVLIVCAWSLEVSPKSKKDQPGYVTNIVKTSDQYLKNLPGLKSDFNLSKITSENQNPNLGTLTSLHILMIKDLYFYTYFAKNQSKTLTPLKTSSKYPLQITNHQISPHHNPTTQPPRNPFHPIKEVAHFFYPLFDFLSHLINTHSP